MTRLRQVARHDGGASALEFALLAVPLLLMIVGTIEYGRALWTQQAMQSLAIATARCIGVSQSECTSSGSYSSTKTNTYLIAEAASYPPFIRLARAAIRSGWGSRRWPSGSARGPWR